MMQNQASVIRMETREMIARFIAANNKALTVQQQTELATIASPYASRKSILRNSSTSSTDSDQTLLPSPSAGQRRVSFAKFSVVINPNDEDDDSDDEGDDNEVFEEEIKVASQNLWRSTIPFAEGNVRASVGLSDLSNIGNNNNGNNNNKSQTSENSENNKPKSVLKTTKGRLRRYITSRVFKNAPASTKEQQPKK